MADTGRTVFADGLWADDLFAAGLWAADEALIVPDVDDPGTSQAAAVAAIEAVVGLIAAVVTAYSSTVPAGEVINQSPAAGTSVPPGTTVTITVSLGEAPSQDQPSGGWEFWVQAENHRMRREERRRRELQIEAETRDIEDAQAREIARLMREQEEKDAERAELDRLQRLADTYSKQRIGLPKDVTAALINAQEMRTRAALLQLQRELTQALETEEMAVVAFLLLITD